MKALSKKPEILLPLRLLPPAVPPLPVVWPEWERVADFALEQTVRVDGIQLALVANMQRDLPLMALILEKSPAFVAP